METFVFDLKESLGQSPILDEVTKVHLEDDRTLEVTLNQSQNLNKVFAQLNALNIEVMSMRNKANRLEELFMGVVDSHFHDGKMSDGMNDGFGHKDNA